MEVTVEPGTYVVAVSGGVDSMVLIDLLRQRPGHKLIVAHFDHGIREDSSQDRQLVQDYAETHKLPFVFHEARLGPKTNEAQARRARYEFLHKIREAAKADAILTAHHQDDKLETAVHNLLRGTGRKGLSSLNNTPYIKRPLLHLTKHQLQAYARAQGLNWREDSTNQDTAYKRNYIRRKLLPKLSPTDKAKLLAHIETTTALNKEIDGLLHLHLLDQSGGSELDRIWFVNLPHQVAREVMAAWLRQHELNFDKKLLEKLVVASKTYVPGKAASVNRDYLLEIQPKRLALVQRDR